jgi:type I restriction enzyme, S subunit
MDVLTETIVVPQLRFNEFEGEWEKNELKPIATKLNVGFVGTCEKFYTCCDNGVKLIRTGNLVDGKITEKNLKYVTNEFHSANKKSQIIKNDILIARHGSNGQACLYNSTEVANSLNIVIVRIDGNQANTKYIMNYMNSPFVKRQVLSKTAGSTQGVINTKEIAKLKLHLPSLPEQKKIATFLSTVDEKLQQLKRKKDLLEEYKKGVMQKIFCQDLRFRDENGNHYPDWEEKQLGDVFVYKNGGSFEKDVVEQGNYFLITLNSIDIEGNLKSDHKKINITDSSLDRGDLIMVLSDVAHGNFLGLTAIIPNDNKYVLNQRMGALKIKTNDNIRFLNQFINYHQKYFKLHGQGSSQQNLSKGDILKFIINIPSLLEQQKIANFLSTMDSKVELVNTQLEKTEAFKKGLLQQMFV